MDYSEKLKFSDDEEDHCLTEKNKTWYVSAALFEISRFTCVYKAVLTYLFTYRITFWKLNKTKSTRINDRSRLLKRPRPPSNIKCNWSLTFSSNGYDCTLSASAL